MAWLKEILVVGLVLQFHLRSKEISHSHNFRKDLEVEVQSNLIKVTNQPNQRSLAIMGMLANTKIANSGTHEMINNNHKLTPKNHATKETIVRIKFVYFGTLGMGFRLFQREEVQ